MATPRHVGQLLLYLIGSQLLASVSFAQHQGEARAGRGIEVVEEPAVPDFSDHARYALVLGNNKYRPPLAPLTNPKRDVALIAGTLSSLGFKVSQEDSTDLSYDEMLLKLRSFARSLPRDAVALFYFAGHGVQIDGVNYLLASHTDYGSPEAVKSSALSEDTVLEALAGPDRMVVVLLDACRNNPFRSGQIDTAVTRAMADGPSIKRDKASKVEARGVLIGYSTASKRTAGDGEPGKNSPFATALAAVLPTPELNIEGAYKNVRAMTRKLTADQQEPWYSSALEGEFYFQPQAPRRAPVRPWAYGVGGAGVAALIAGGGTGLAALARSKSAHDACPEPERGAVGCTGAEVSESERAVRLANASNVLLGAGAACLIAGVLGFIFRGAEPRGERSTGFMLDPGRDGLMLRAWTRGF